MPFDGLITKAIVTELNTCLINGKVTKIFEPNKNEIILGIYSNGVRYAVNLNISSNYYSIYLTTNKQVNPTTAPNFCMLLRKYLIGKKISKISSDSLERIVNIEFIGYNELNDLTTLKLIVELMGKHSNVILVNEKNIIIDSLRHLDSSTNSTRDILPAHYYTLPESKKLDITKDMNELYDQLKHKDSDIINLFSNNFTGISKTFISNLLNILNIDNTFTFDNFKKVYEYINNLINNLNYYGCGVNTGNDYTIIYNKKSNNLDLNFFLDDYYNSKILNDTFISYRNNILKLILEKIKKLSKKLSVLNTKLEECEDSEKYRIYGELLTNNLYRINSRNVHEVHLENYYNNNELLEISLDPSISPANNAKKYFKKYNKLKTAFHIVSSQKQDIESEINYLETIVYSVEVSKTIEDLNEVYNELIQSGLIKEKSKVVSKNNKDSEGTKFLEFNIDGFKVLVGKNNKQNDYLTNKVANSGDLWFHTKDIHGSHVILKIENGVQPSQETINKVATLAAKYSKASHSSNIPVDYTFIRYVKRITKSKPGMVNYTNYKTVNVNID